MAKTFTNQEPRQPRGVDADPAFKAATSAFGSPGGTGTAAAPPAADAEPGGTGPAAADTPTAATGASTTGATPDTASGGNGTTVERPAGSVPPPVLPESKMTIYPGTVERARLATIKLHHRLAESIVAEYALEELFQHRTDEEIVTVLRGRGHGLRRARTAPTP
jgi:hypothetical protein